MSEVQLKVNAKASDPAITLLEMGFLIVDSPIVLFTPPNPWEHKAWRGSAPPWCKPRKETPFLAENTVSFSNSFSLLSGGC
ncbi:hypothetical protein R83H12_03011 [Fibrobacteria bacterium R8-3-H12]